MKWLVVAFIVVSATQVLGERCQSAEDCEEGECCVNYAIVSLFGGHCRKMRQEGESCTPLIREKDTDEPPKMYHFQCPCTDGLKCVAQHEIKIGEVIVKHRPECVVPGKEDEVTTILPQPDPE